MSTLSPEIIQLISTFSVAFTTPTFQKILILLWGTILAPGRRTVAAALRVMGLSTEKHFSNYHRVLNRDRWSPWLLSQLLFDLLLRYLQPADQPILLLIDETIERRRGNQIRYKGWFRDPVRSSGRFLTAVLGIRWICLALLVPVPWNSRPWALPFMIVPALSKATSEKLGKHHRTVVEWASWMITRVRRWQPERQIILVGDGTYAALHLTRVCQSFPHPVVFVSRLRLDASLHDFPVQKSKFGPKPKKGERRPNLAMHLESPDTAWQTLRLDWYAGKKKTVEVVSQVCLWAKRAADPVPLRWVLVRCLHDPHFKPEAFYCSDTQVAVDQIVLWVLARWNIEVTFEELRMHLGFETQRQWSQRAIERSTPGLMGLFSLVILMAHALYPQDLPVRTASWYSKTEATFCDALAAVRLHFWKSANRNLSSENQDLSQFHPDPLASLWEIACYST